MLQLHNLDQATYEFRNLIIQKIAFYLEKREHFAKASPDYIQKVSRKIDELLFIRAPKLFHYMDLDTLEARVNDFLNYVSYRNQRDSWISSTGPSTINLHQLPEIQMTDSSVYHGRVDPAFTNLPARARDVPTHSMFTSQRYLPHNHNVATVNFHPTERPESFRSTVVASCVSAGLGGIASAGLSNGHVKGHFPGHHITNDMREFLPGDAHPIDSPISSMSGSSSPLSAVCDPTTSSSTMIRSSVDSISKASGQKLSAGSDSTSEGQSFQRYRVYEKKVDDAWSLPAEQSIHSNSTIE
ncbi:unnamed protein product, partial [Urochloa humidicola]